MVWLMLIMLGERCERNLEKNKNKNKNNGIYNMRRETPQMIQRERNDQ